MKHLKIAILGLLTLFTISATSCSQEKPEQQVKAVEGWDNGQKVVQVTDNNGQQFLMNYLLFNSLMNQGGYNSVVHHYHNNLNSHYYRPVTSSYKPYKQVTGFTDSYKKTVTNNNTFKPVVKSNYKASDFKLSTSKSTSKPYIYNSNRITTGTSSNGLKSSYKPSTPSSYKSSSYRSSYRSSYSPSRSSFSRSSFSSSRSSFRH